MSRNSLLETDAISEVEADATGFEHNHLFRKRTVNSLAKMAKWLNFAKWLTVRLRTTSGF